MTLKLFPIVLSLLWAVSHGQQPGTQKAETHPQISIQLCTKSGCQTQQKSVTLDANWRWLHNVGGYTNCYTGSGAGSNNVWNKQYCPDAKTCAQKCALDGADYPGTYGVHAQGNSVKLDFVIPGQYGTDVGSRVYLMDSETEYFMFKLKNKEFTFDVDVSNLPCGLNGALYMIQMDADGGTTRFPTNKAGAKYGTGYCDAQCPHDIKFINGEANLQNWNTTSATGMYGTCCSEMDIWEANSISTAYTPHACSVSQQTRCSGIQCGDDSKNQRHQGVCDKDGCDFNPYRLGDRTFFGPSGDAIDTTQKITVITQFVTADDSDTGDLKEIRRVWRQNGKTVQSRNVTVGGGSFNSVSDPFCSLQKKAFGDPNDFSKHGGIKQMGAAMDKGMVLAMSLWDDHAAYMLWLDSDYPLTKPANSPGVARGTCATTSGRPSDVEKNHPHSSVTYSNIKFGDIGSTF